MSQSPTKSILAVVSLDANILLPSSAPTFIAKDQKELELIASELGRSLMGNVYELSNGVILITQV